MNPECTFSLGRFLVELPCRLAEKKQLVYICFSFVCSILCLWISVVDKAYHQEDTKLRTEALPMANPLPSVLDSPRFFDDETLSAWHLATTGVDDGPTTDKVASTVGRVKRAIPGVRLYDSMTQDYLPQQTARSENGDPIAVEIVRGLDNPLDQEWKVVVDGVLQSKGHRLQQDEENPRRFVCKLPKGVDSVDNAKYARPVVIAIRLENEALAPLVARGKRTDHDHRSTRISDFGRRTSNGRKL